MQEMVLRWGRFLTDVSCNDRAGETLQPETFDSKRRRTGPQLPFFDVVFLLISYFPGNCLLHAFPGPPQTQQLGAAKPFSHNQCFHPARLPHCPC